MTTTKLTAEQAADLTVTRPLHRRPLVERFVIANALAGHLVTVIDDTHRDGTLERDFTGVLLGPARHSGGGSAPLVIRLEAGDLFVLSMARVSRIELRA